MDIGPSHLLPELLKSLDPNSWLAWGLMQSVLRKCICQFLWYDSVWPPKWRIRKMGWQNLTKKACSSYTDRKMDHDGPMMAPWLNSDWVHSVSMDSTLKQFCGHSSSRIRMCGDNLGAARAVCLHQSTQRKHVFGGRDILRHAHKHKSYLTSLSQITVESFNKFIKS